MSFRLPILLSAFLISGFALPAAAQAQDGGKKDQAGSPAALQKLLDCRAIQDDRARLACFDGAVSQFDAARQRGDVAVVDRESVRKTKRGLFGFSLSDLPLFGDGNRDDKSDDVDEITAKVRSASRGPDGWIVTLDNGATWAQTDATMLGRSPKPGMTVTIKRAAFGSYKMSFEKGPAMKAKRVG